MVKGKVKVIRITGKTIQNPKSYLIENGRVIIKSTFGGANNPKYEPPFDLERVGESGFLKRPTCIYQDGADKLVPLQPEGAPPMFTIRDYLKPAGEKIIAQQAKTNLNVTPIQYVEIILLIGLCIAVFLIMARLGIINVG